MLRTNALVLNFNNISSWGEREESEYEILENRSPFEKQVAEGSGDYGDHTRHSHEVSTQAACTRNPDGRSGTGAMLANSRSVVIVPGRPCSGARPSGVRTELRYQCRLLYSEVLSYSIREKETCDFFVSKVKMAQKTSVLILTMPLASYGTRGKSCQLPHSNNGRI